MSLRAIAIAAVTFWMLVSIAWLVVFAMTLNAEFKQGSIDAAQWAAITYGAFRYLIEPPEPPKGRP